MHLRILSVIHFTDLTLGVLMIHLFTFDAQWLGAVPARDQPVLFFDGVCGLCNGFIDFVLKEDIKHRLVFAPLQGETARRVLNPDALEAMDSVVLVADGQTFRRSSAILRVLTHLGGIWSVLASVAGMLPRRFLDFLYTVVARHRYQWFRRHACCRLPTRDEKAFFLD